MLASHAQNNKCIYSGEASGLRVSQVQACSFQGLLLVPVGPPKPLLSVGRVPQATPSKSQSGLKVKEPAAAKASARSQNNLLDELTAIAAEVTGTSISANAPLMDSGLDSIGATEFSNKIGAHLNTCLLYTSPSPRDATLSRMPSSA